MVFEFDSGVKVAVRDRLLSELLDDLCELGFESESGGILLGSYDSGRDEYRIVDFTRPGLQDERAQTYFIRDRVSANKAIRNAWERSNGTVNYLGEWHTHNEIDPIPSETDKKLMRQIAEDDDCVFDRFFMMIIGGGGGIFCGEVKRNSAGQFAGSRRSWWARNDG